MNRNEDNKLNNEMTFNVKKYPKPDQSQTFYPSPPSMLAPNRNIRAPEERLDARTANVLANKERELMQSANKIEYFADGLGTRAPLNSDDLAEKVARFVSTSQVVQDKMVCFVIIKHTTFNFCLHSCF